MGKRGRLGERGGYVEMWRCGDVEVWRCGGVEVWRCGVEVWRRGDARIAKPLDQDKRILLMKSFVISQLNSCPIIWMYCQHQSDNLINKIHERALRIAYNDYTSDFKALLEKDCTAKIHQRNIHML